MLLHRWAQPDLFYFLAYLASLGPAASATGQPGSSGAWASSQYHDACLVAPAWLRVLLLRQSAIVSVCLQRGVVATGLSEPLLVGSLHSPPHVCWRSAPHWPAGQASARPPFEALSWKAALATMFAHWSPFKGGFFGRDHIQSVRSAASWSLRAASGGSAGPLLQPC